MIDRIKVSIGRLFGAAKIATTVSRRASSTTVLTLVAFCGTLPASALAENLVAFDFTATVDSVVDDEGLLGGTVTVGQTLTGFFQYDLDVADGSSDSQFGSYDFDLLGINQMRSTNGVFNNATDDGFFVSVVDSAEGNGFDVFDIEGSSFTVSSIAPELIPGLEAEFLLQDSTGAALTADTLPDAFTLSDWDDKAFFVSNFDSGSISPVGVFGTVTSLVPGTVRGSSPQVPLLPSPPIRATDPWQFNNISRRRWFDPPLVNEFSYATTDGSLFTHLTLPDETVVDDADNSYDVTVGGVTKSFTPGSMIDLINEFNLADGTAGFTIGDIEGPVDAADLQAFPVFLDFNAPLVSFTITPVTLSGDFNSNGEVEAGDLDLVLFNWNVDGVELTADWIDQRPSAGITVGPNQLDDVLFNWGVTVLIATVPEPEDLTMVVWMVLVGWVALRRFSKCHTFSGTPT